jgi:micrococcal nuclease
MRKQNPFIIREIVFMILLVITAILISGCDELTNTLSHDPPPDALSDIEYQEGVVEYVIDGDTFDIKLENGEIERIRPILVDAPELCHASSPADCEVEPFGNEATNFTKELLEGEIVYLEQDISERDPYDRLLVYVYLEDGQMFQELILSEGLAEIAVYEPDVKYQSHLETFEQKAKGNQINIWSD